MPSSEPTAEQTDLTTSLKTSLASVWNRYAGTAPQDAEVTVGEGVVRWSVMKDSADALKDGIASRDGQDGTPARTLAGFERETASVVTKAMHRKVAARFSKRTKDGVATEVFVLEAIRRKN